MDKKKLIYLIQDLSLAAQEMAVQDYVSNKSFDALEDWKVAKDRHNKIYQEILKLL